jgi:glycosyltransferase involved in cell wall biosynthesis
MKSNITFILFSYNDAYRIEYVIKNLLPFGEVLVFDDTSTDNTKEVVERLGVPFIPRPKVKQPFVETEETFLFVRPFIKTPWLYWGWTDNLLTKNLLEKMVELSNQTHYKRAALPVYTYMWGHIDKPMMKAKYPNFFMPDHVTFKDNYVHHFGTFLGKPEEDLQLPYNEKAAIYHFSLYNMEKFVLGHLRYANEEARFKHQTGIRKFSLYYTFGSMFNYFRLFYLNGGWRMGMIGFLNGLLFAFSRLLVAVRLYEIENGITVEAQEKIYQQGKQRILDEIEGKKNE